MKHPPHPLHSFDVLVIAGEVAKFARVAYLVVKFRAPLALVPLRVAPAFGADAVTHKGLTVAAAPHLREGGLVPRCARVLQQRRRLRPRDCGAPPIAAQVGQRRVNIDSSTRPTRRFALALAPGSAMTSGARAVLQTSSASSTARAGRAIAVVAPENDDCVHQFQSVERAEQLPICALEKMTRRSKPE